MLQGTDTQRDQLNKKISEREAERAWQRKITKPESERIMLQVVGKFSCKKVAHSHQKAVLLIITKDVITRENTPTEMH